MSGDIAALLHPASLLLRGRAALHNLRARLPGPVPGTVVLDLQGGHREREPPRRWPPLLPQPQGLAEASLEGLARSLEEIRSEPRLETLLIRLGSLSPQLGTAASLRALLGETAQRVRLRVHAPSLSLLELWVASAGAELWIPPGAELHLLGIRAEAVFLRQLLDRWGVEPQIERISPHKTAADPLLFARMSDSMRENLESLTGSLYDTLVGQTAASRGLDRAALLQLVDRGLLQPEEARRSGLVDGLAYEDELVGPPAATLSWPAARRRLRLRPPPLRPVVAVVSVEGLLVPGRSRRLPLPVPLLGRQAGAQSVAAGLRQAERSRWVEAVVLHVDSRGGSALASDLIWREVARLDRTKPVVAYLGNVAASGGYYLAAAARRIVCQPTTLTGSIGVIAGKLVLRGLLERLGLHPEAVQQGASAGLMAPTEPLSGSQRRRLRELVEATQDRFRERVSQGRGLQGEELERVLGGRVWTGSQARELGLVDELGDLRLAARRALEAAGRDPERGFHLLDVHPPAHMDAPLPWESAGFEALVWALMPFELRLRL